MIRSFVWVGFLLLAQSSIAQENKYATALIPAALRKNTHSVKRNERYEFEIRSASRALLTTSRAITLLDETAKDELSFYASTSKFYSLGDVSILLYDSNGVLMKKYNRKDLSSASNGEELVPDGKVYYLKPNVNSYPVTIEFLYEINYNGLYTYPAFHIQEPGQSVERTAYVLRIPREMEFRYRAKNTSLEPVIDETDKKYRSYTWTASLLPARQYEEGSGPLENSFPLVMLAPTKFDLDGYEGDMSSWKNLGLWYNSLVKQENRLSPEYKNEIIALVKDAKSDMEKISIIYAYLQKNFRYVSIQLGIGGLKPFPADFVHKKKYGDCKALSNYMEACLNAVNIKSYSAWIKSGSAWHLKNSDPDFVYEHFNHQVLCIPRQKDSVWLECTSSTTEPGFLGSFTQDREALLLTENGGVLVQTPKYAAAVNGYHSNTLVKLNEDGSGTANVSIRTGGEFRQDFINYVADQVKDEQKSFLMNGLEFLQPDKFEISYDKNSSNSTATISMEIEKIPDFTAGTKFFLNPRIYKLWNTPLPEAGNRTQDFYFRNPFEKTDTTIYKLPSGYVPESIPKAKEYKFEYGSLFTSYSFDEQNKYIISTAKFVLNEYKIPAEKFSLAKKFFNDVLAEYNEKIVVKRL